MLRLLKSVLPDHPVPMRVWRGPFRGARVVMNPRSSLRKALGLYEHELNGWLEEALHDVTRVLDVGANDGYFTFGCAAAFKRLGIAAEIVAFEAQERHVAELKASVAAQADGQVHIDIRHAFVGASTQGGTFALDDLAVADRSRTLIKLDVEGAEEDVIAGAQSWLTAGNRFVIEVHKREFIERLQQTFASRGLQLRLVEQQPLRLLGREERAADNWWLVSQPAGRS
jgi:hypothetical protein